MKLQIDITAKTIVLPEPVNIGELIKQLAQMFPDEQWREFSIIQSQFMAAPWENPILIQPYRGVPIQPFTSPTTYPYPWITCSTGELEENKNAGMAHHVIRTTNQMGIGQGNVSAVDVHSIYNVEIEI